MFGALQNTLTSLVFLATSASLVSGAPLTLLGLSIPGLSLEGATPFSTQADGATVYSVAPFTRPLTTISGSQYETTYTHPGYTATRITLTETTTFTNSAGETSTSTVVRLTESPMTPTPTLTTKTIEIQPTTVVAENDGKLVQDAKKIHFAQYHQHGQEQVTDCELQEDGTEKCVEWRSFGGATMTAATLSGPAVPWYTVA